MHQKLFNMLHDVLDSHAPLIKVRKIEELTPRINKEIRHLMWRR